MIKSVKWISTQALAQSLHDYLSQEVATFGTSSNMILLAYLEQIIFIFIFIANARSGIALRIHTCIMDVRAGGLERDLSMLGNRHNKP